MSNIPLQLSKSARKLGARASYGEPVKVGGSTVVPVALTWFGFGGGGDRPDSEGVAAGGGGGGGASIPVGAYVGRGDAEADFEPNVIALLAVSVPLVWALGGALSRLVRALKK